MDQPTQVLQLIWRGVCQVAALKAPLGGAFLCVREGGASGSLTALPV
jgi:hypothetical protein